MAETTEAQRKRLEQLEASCRKERTRLADEVEEIRLELHRAQDQAAAQRARADLAESRLVRVSDLLGRDLLAAADSAITEWVASQKRRPRG